MRVLKALFGEIDGLRFQMDICPTLMSGFKRNFCGTAAKLYCK